MTFISILMCLLLKTFIGLLSFNNILELWNIKTIVANFGLLFAGYHFFKMIGINNPIWYICILIQCYLFYYFVSYCAESSRVKKTDFTIMVAYLFLIVISMITFHYGLLDELAFRGWASFSIGVILCAFNHLLLNKHIIKDENRKYFGLIFLGLAILFSGGVFLGINQRWILQFFVFPSLIVFLTNTNVPHIKLISDLGDISFELYLFHYPLMVLVQLILMITGSSLNHSYITIILFLLSAWICAWLIWKYLDNM